MPYQIIESTNWNHIKNNNTKNNTIPKQNKCKTTLLLFFKLQSDPKRPTNRVITKTCARKFTSTITTHRSSQNDRHKAITTRRSKNSNQKWIIWLSRNNNCKLSKIKTVIMKPFWKRSNPKTLKSWWKERKRDAFTKSSSPRTTSASNFMDRTTPSSTSSSSILSSARACKRLSATSQSLSVRIHRPVRLRLPSMRLRIRSKTEAESFTRLRSRRFRTRSTESSKKSLRTWGLSQVMWRLTRMRLVWWWQQKSWETWFTVVVRLCEKWNGWFSTKCTTCGTRSEVWSGRRRS